MEASASNNTSSDAFRPPSSASGLGLSSLVGGSHHSINTSNSSRQGVLSASNIIRAPISTLLEYSGLLRPRSLSHNHEAESLIRRGRDQFRNLRSLDGDSDGDASVRGNDGEVAIRIIGAGGEELGREAASVRSGGGGQTEVHVVSDGLGGSGSDLHGEEGVSANGVAGDGEDTEGGGSGRDSYQRYDIHQAARWIEQVLPFSLLLLIVFIRQHLQGFFVTIWIAAVLFKSNDILRKQTALKGERKISVLVGICVAFMLHVVSVYWWYSNDDLLYPLVMLPPKSVPPFWHALFIIVVNDILARQAAMALKCLLLVCCKNCRGRNYRKQGQMLTLVEYLFLLYRALLPTPVWYRFFLNKEYGSLFSSLMTGLYLTFKLTSVVEKVQSFFTALKALSRKEVHYGSYATSEQVIATGDLCAICQEKMHAPVLLRCKHIFCEDCVSEWFERERTCPLCRAVVKPADLKSFGDGSTSLFFQIF